MPLTQKQQKLLKTMTKGLIAEISEAFGRNHVFKALDFLHSATQSNDQEFNSAIQELKESQREGLNSFRNLYLTAEGFYLGQDKIDQSDIQAEIIRILKAHENKLRSPTPLVSESKDTFFNWGRADPHAERPNQAQLLSKSLDLRPGDIIISEMAFEDAAINDFQNFQDFAPGHTSIWTGQEFERPLVHAVREGYRPAGLKSSDLWVGRHMVFRLDNSEVAREATQIIRNWASAEKLFTQEDYIKSYPEAYWRSRHKRDLQNYFLNEAKEADPSKKIAGPATIYGEPRATYDLLDLGRNKSLAKLGDEGIRRAIKFAAMKYIDDSAVSKKGQRCTPIAVAAFQASILAPIVRQFKTKPNFKQYKNKRLAEYANEVFIEGWETTSIGKILLQAMKSGDYSQLFPPPFAVDQRYATPQALFEAIKNSVKFKKIGSFSYFNNELIKVEAANTSFIAIQSPMSSNK